MGGRGKRRSDGKRGSHPGWIYAAGNGRSAVDVAAAAQWGLLRNAFQEFARPKFSGYDVDCAALSGWQQQGGLPEASDAFGVAMSGCAWYTPRVLPAQSAVREQPLAAIAGQHWVITGALSVVFKELKKIRCRM